MNYETFKGSPYEMGFHYGSSLITHGKYILSQVPFPITEERLRFARRCLSLYQSHCPALTEELQGLADGQKCSFDQLCGVLFTMYCPAPNPRCSCFAIRTPGGTFFGRNSDFLTDLQDTYSNCFYQPEGDGLSFIGNTTSFIQMEDGVNEYGLSIGLTSVYPAVIKEGLNAGMILRLILQTCRTVPEAVRLAHELPIASSQTFVLTDRSGTIALMELNSCQKEIVIPEGEKAFVCSTNLFHTPRMKSYNNLSLDNWQAEERYQTLFKTLQTRAGRFTREDGFRLLSGAEGFLCQYDRSTGKDTVWSILYDTAARSLYFADGNPSRVPFCADTRLKFIPQP